MKKQIMLNVVAAIVVSLPAMAQGGPPPGPGGPRGMAGHFGGRFGPGFGHGKVVTNAPYTASLSNQVVQHLSDGDSVVRTTTGQVARDGVGRTYEQVTITGGPLGQNTTKTLTFISDPVAGLAYTLDSATNTAIQRPFHARTGGNDPGPGNGVHARTRPNRPDVTESDAPADSSSGVVATGKTITHTVPAGTMGNQQPIVSTDQVWYSADLQIVVKSIRKDPFFGDSTYALTNVVQKEPDPSLFTVPSGYTVKTADAPRARGPRGGGSGGPPPQQ